MNVAFNLANRANGAYSNNHIGPSFLFVFTCLILSCLFDDAISIDIVCRLSLLVVRVHFVTLWSTRKNFGSGYLF
jgi:hypothetical protein